MLRSYKFKNFYSFADETEISFVMNKHVPDNNLITKRHDGISLSKIMAVIGPNASGKTNSIKPLVFLNWFISDSFYDVPDEEIPIRTNFFQENPNAEFSLEFDYQNTTWKYDLEINRDRVVKESLYKKTSRLFSYVFERNWDDAKQNYSIKQQNFGLSSKEAEKVRSNASLLSTASHFGVELATDLTTTCVFSNVNAYGREHTGVTRLLETADYYYRSPAIFNQMKNLLKQWDFGMSDIVIEKQLITNTVGEQVERNLPSVVHSCGEVERKQFLRLESSGTQGAFVILADILPALYYGGVAVIDELEADLHPHMIEPIVNLFCNQETNPHNAQIIFTCHTIEVLNLLNKAQVVLVEKNQSCHSNAWRLDTVKGVRNDDNLYAKYMSGAYGAIPNL